jgi:hypothetical protein
MRHSAVRGLAASLDGVTTFTAFGASLAVELAGLGVVSFGGFGVSARRRLTRGEPGENLNKGELQVAEAEATGVVGIAISLSSSMEYSTYVVIPPTVVKDIINLLFVKRKFNYTIV